MSTTELATVSSSVNSLARSISVDPRELLDALKNQIMPNAKDAEMMAFCMVAKKYGLDPFVKQVYAVRKNGSGAYEAWISIDGWCTMVERHPQTDGHSFEYVRDGNDNIIGVTCTMWRKDRSRPCVVTEFLAECKKDTGPWDSHPLRMTRHRAFIQCARMTYGIADASGGDDPEAFTPMDPPKDPAKSLTAALLEKQPPPPATGDAIDAVVAAPDDDELDREIDALAATLVESARLDGKETTKEKVIAKAHTQAKKSDRSLLEVLNNWAAKARQKDGTE